MELLGFVKPITSPPTNPIRFPVNGLNLRIRQSLAVTAVAWILMSTSLFLGVGFLTSWSSRTSGRPYFVHTIAFIIFLRGIICATTLYGKAIGELLSSSKGLNHFNV